MTSNFVALCCFVGFVVLGATQSLYGPAIPAFLGMFGIGAQDAATPLAAHFVGGTIGVLLFARLRRRASVRSLVAVCYLVMGVGALAFALSPRWGACVAAAAVLGLGCGGIDYGLNGLAASDASPRGTVRLNVLHACFGLGAIGGPWLLGAFGDARYGVLFGICAVVSVALAVATVVRFPASGREAAAAPVLTPREDERAGGGLAVVVAFVAFYVILVGLETGVGGWEPSHLIGLGYGAGSADRATAGFWFALTAGRIAVIPLLRRTTPRTMVTGCFAAMTVALLATAIAPFAPVAYLLVGLFMAPIFPTGLPWLLEAVPRVRGALAWVFAASMLGGVIVPPVLGEVVAGVGVGSLPACLAGLSAVALLICLGLAAGAGRQAGARLAAR